jgi:hypothetical protein
MTINWEIIDQAISDGEIECLEELLQRATADVCYRLDMIDAARKDTLKRAVKLCDLLTSIYMRRGDLDRAKEISRRVVEINEQLQA